MRLRFFFFFSLVALAAIFGVVLFIRLETPNLVRTYLFRGGMLGIDGLVRSLEAHYRQNRTWDDVETIFDSHQRQFMNGAGNRRRNSMMTDMVLVDVDGQVRFSSNASQSDAAFSSDTLEQSIHLRNLRGQTIGYLVVAGNSLAVPGDESTLLQSLNTAAIRAGLIALGVALILALVLAGSLLRPVRELTFAAKKLSAGDLSQRVKVDGGDEIETLAQSFNQMAESLQNSELRRKSVTADIAHELRTPLAVQGAQIEAMIDGVYPLNEENLTKALDQNRLLSRLVEDLRILALADAGELTLDKVEIDPAELTSRVIERFQLADSEKAIVFENNCHAGIKINADPARIEQILSNLISNALRYTQEHGQIQVTLADKKAGFIEICVQDNGPGIPTEALERIFDRFYRGEISRSRSQGGTGLGLSIARQLAIAHGGSLSAENNPQGGAVFRLVLPV